MHFNPDRVVADLRQAESIVFSTRSTVAYPLRKRSAKITEIFDRLSREPRISLIEGAQDYVKSEQRKGDPWEGRQRQFLIYVLARRLAVPLNARDVDAWGMESAERLRPLWPWERGADKGLR